ncbi:hypothetical protein B0H19DRAFT_1249107 [Mycena capillaripes]|nr:hypothetical protein B0H19DRAFT_1249107 [Mycena capillaripes]
MSVPQARRVEDRVIGLQNKRRLLLLPTLLVPCLRNRAPTRSVGSVNAGKAISPPPRFHIRPRVLCWESTPLAPGATIWQNLTAQLGRAPRPNKAPYSCHTCAKGHVGCSSWKELHDVFASSDMNTLGGFQFQYWEHLGGSIFEPLLPDPRVADLKAVGSPVQAATRARARQSSSTNRACPKSSSSSRKPMLHEVPDSLGSEDDINIVPPPSNTRITDDPANYDLDVEMAPAPSQQASSSRHTLDDPPQLCIPLRDVSDPKHYGPFTGLPGPSFFSLDPPRQSLSTSGLRGCPYSPETLRGDADEILRFYEENPGGFRELQVAYLQSVLSVAGQELVRPKKEPKSRKGKGRETSED